MLLAIDIGNTSVSFGLFSITPQSDNLNKPQKTLQFSSKFSSLAPRCTDEYAILFEQLTRLHGYSTDLIDCAAISSVVPHLTDAVCEAADLISGKQPYIIAPGIRTGFKIAVYDPATLGTDIVSNISAALEIVQPPLVIFDAGTANTLTYVDSHRNVYGTVISPGLRISAEALTDNAELIDTATLGKDSIPWIGKNTAESISSGVILGNSLMVDGFIRNIRESYLDRNNGEKLSLIATGGYSDIITSHTRNKFLTEKDLTLNGIASLFILNTFN
jgi:type III pantothenate kinase